MNPDKQEANHFLLGPVLGTVLDGWRLSAFLGRGGMGSVYRAVHTESGISAALKLLHPAAGAPSDSLRRFRREVQALARLSHPAIVRILQESLAHSPAYFCMELLPGGSLAERIRKHLPAADSAAPVVEPGWLAILFSELAEGLAVIHEARILHRDLKPANVLFTIDGHAKLTDFGLAKILDATAMTAPMQRMGSLPYMAPETLRASTYDERSDLYQLGATVFHAACGHAPYSNEQLLAVLRGEPLPPLLDLSKLAPAATGELPWLQAVLERLMAGEPTDRFESAKQLLDELRCHASPSGSGLAVQRPLPVGRAPLPRRPGRLSRTMAVLLSASLVLWSVCLALFAIWWTRSPGTTHRQPGPFSSPAGPPAPGRPAPAAVPHVQLLTVGPGSVRLWFEAPAPAGCRLELRSEGAPSSVSRVVTTGAADYEFDGLAVGTRYEGWCSVGTRRAPLRFETLKLARTPGGVLVCPAGSDASQLRVQARGLHLAAVWLYPGAKAQQLRLEACHSLDGGRTWSAPEMLASGALHPHSVDLALGPSGALVAWREGLLSEPGSTRLRHFTLRTKRWGPTSTLSTGTTRIGLFLLPREDLAELFLVVDAPGESGQRALARATFALDLSSALELAPLVSLTRAAGGALRVLGPEGGYLALCEEKRPAAGTWNLLWTGTIPGNPPGPWLPVRSLTSPEEDLGRFETATFRGSHVVAYSTAESIQVRVVSRDLRAVTPRVSIGRGDFVQRSPSLAVLGDQVYLGLVGIPSVTRLSGALRIFKSADGLQWQLHTDTEILEPGVRTVRLVAWQGKLVAVLLGEFCGLTVHTVAP